MYDTVCERLKWGTEICILLYLSWSIFYCKRNCIGWGEHASLALASSTVLYFLWLFAFRRKHLLIDLACWFCLCLLIYFCSVGHMHSIHWNDLLDILEFWNILEYFTTYWFECSRKGHLNIPRLICRLYSVLSYTAQKSHYPPGNHMLATAKMLFPGHNHLLITSTDDPSLTGARAIIKVKGHQHLWLAGGHF